VISIADTPEPQATRPMEADSIQVQAS
jgi:hypothetical protein